MHLRFILPEFADGLAGTDHIFTLDENIFQVGIDRIVPPMLDDHGIFVTRDKLGACYFPIKNSIDIGLFIGTDINAVIGDLDAADLGVRLFAEPAGDVSVFHRPGQPPLVAFEIIGKGQVVIWRFRPVAGSESIGGVPQRKRDSPDAGS